VLHGPTTTHEKNLELIFRVSRLLTGESLRLSQVLTNLLGNALKFEVHI